MLNNEEEQEEAEEEEDETISFMGKSPCVKRKILEEQTQHLFPLKCFAVDSWANKYTEGTPGIG